MSNLPEHYVASDGSIHSLTCLGLACDRGCEWLNEELELQKGEEDE
jgi:hypothetical protein